MMSVAKAVTTMALASGDDSHNTRWRHSGLTPRTLRSIPANTRAAPSGNAITIQPAKWFLFTNGPNKSLRSSGVQNPHTLPVVTVAFCTMAMRAITTASTATLAARRRT